MEPQEPKDTGKSPNQTESFGPGEPAPEVPVDKIPTRDDGSEPVSGVPGKPRIRQEVRHIPGAIKARVNPDAETMMDTSPGQPEGVAPAANVQKTLSGLSAEDRSEELRKRILAKIADGDDAEQAAAAGPDPLIGMEVGGRFKIESKIGEGGMGAVYRARQKGMDRDVAIKVLLKQMGANATVVKRFTLEALAVSKLRHPNTIQIFDFGETEDEQLYIAMEFLEGTSLQDLLHKQGALPVRTAIRVALQVAKSLREAHSKGIVHRDLKPDNIFLITVGEEKDFVKVLDFGVAKLREQDKTQATLTKAGAIFGTPRYMSPEQGMSSGSADHRSDIYSIGVILYEMLTGRPPFDSDNALGILVQHMQEPVPAMFQMRPDLVIPDEVEMVTRRCLEKSPDDRPQTAEALIRELEELERGLDEVYAKVVTSDYAEQIGLEYQRASPTQADTHLLTQTGQDLRTAAGMSDETIYTEGGLKKKGGKLKWILAAAVVAVVAAGGGVYAALQPLPDDFRDDEGRVSLLGSGPESGADALPAVSDMPELDIVNINIDSAPRGAEVWLGDEKVGDTPYRAARMRDPDKKSVMYRVKLAGYEPASVEANYGADVDQNVSLKKKEEPKPVVAKPEPRPEPTRPRPDRPKKPSKPEPVATTKPEPKPEPKPDKPKPNKNPFGSNIDDIK